MRSRTGNSSTGGSYGIIDESLGRVDGPDGQTVWPLSYLVGEMERLLAV